MTDPIDRGCEREDELRADAIADQRRRAGLDGKTAADSSETCNACGEPIPEARRQAVPGVQVAPARGGMYAFFRVAGYGDSLATAKRLVLEAGLGLAPGSAFGPEAAGWLRWSPVTRPCHPESQ